MIVINKEVERSRAKLWAGNDLFAFSALTLFLDMYGNEQDDDKTIQCLKWTPETIEMELHDDCGPVSAAAFERLMTAISILTTNSFFVSATDFARDCVTLSGHVNGPEGTIMPDSEDIAWGITEAILISPLEKNDDNPFNEEIVGFIHEVLNAEGILSPPDVLRIAMKGTSVRDRVNYEFSDDPELFAAIHQTEQAKTDFINQTLRARMKSLLQQFQELPLENGNTSIVGKMINKL